MVRRVAALAVLAWLLGFLWFAIALPQPESETRTDAVIVFTGGSGRIDRAIEVLRKGWADRLLVSGVDREVRPREFRTEYGVSRRRMECCITLGYESVDTRTNATEAAAWIAENDFSSIRLVTTDWHMRRADFELERNVSGVEILRDAVPSQPSLRILFLEYHKLLARRVSSIWEK